MIAGCTPESTAPPPDRAARYGIFRDLVWFPPSSEGRGGFFLDLFESSQADWRAYRAAHGEAAVDTDRFLSTWSVSGRVDPVMPVVGIDLHEARAFARWRFGRVPRYDEWEYAATARGRYTMPWGNLPRAAYANAAELRFNRLAPVGMFESGRQAGGPYDLIGNAAEWSETPRVEGDGSFAGSVFGMVARVRDVSHHPALRGWWLAALPLPSYPLIMVDSDRVARRLALGADRPMLGAAGLRPVDPEFRRPEERGSLLGVRVAADPGGLIDALLAEVEPPPAEGDLLLRAFLRRHLRELRPAWRVRVGTERAGTGPLAEVLRDELGG